MENKLIQMAIDATKYSYCPISHFSVGAALLSSSGEIYTGCNIENSSCGLTNCAERTAIFKAVSSGEIEFKSIAIMGSSDNLFQDFCTPCGACRQVLNEFCDENFEVILGKIVDNSIEIKKFKLIELLPEAFKL